MVESTKKQGTARLVARWMAGAAVVGFLAGGMAGCGYNDIQRGDEATKSAWAEVLSQYQRRADLIPNLVNTVKGYAAQEKEVLLGVTEARSRVGQGQQQANPAGAALLERLEAHRLPEGLEEALPTWEVGESLATRAASGKVLSALAGAEW